MTGGLLAIADRLSRTSVRRNASFLPALRISSRLSVCPSVRPSQVPVLLKRPNVRSRKQRHTIAHAGTLVFWC